MVLLFLCPVLQVLLQKFLWRSSDGDYGRVFWRVSSFAIGSRQDHWSCRETLNIAATSYPLLLWIFSSSCQKHSIHGIFCCFVFHLAYPVTDLISLHKCSLCSTPTHALSVISICNDFASRYHYSWLNLTRLYMNGSSRIHRTQIIIWIFLFTIYYHFTCILLSGFFLLLSLLVHVYYFLWSKIICFCTKTYTRVCSLGALVA